MYYRGSHDPKTGTGGIPAHREVTCYAESEDGIHWVKPELGLVEFNGSKANTSSWTAIASRTTSRRSRTTTRTLRLTRNTRPSAVEDGGAAPA